MKRIGLIGGLGPESTVDYYRIIINEYRDKMKGNAPEIIIYSLNLAEFPRMNQKHKLIEWLAGAIKLLCRAGADFAIITANTPHIVFNEVNALSPIPLVSIVEETCQVVRNLNFKKVGLFGTKVTMGGEFYQRVFSRHDISIVVPTPQEQDYINDKLVSEIVYNRIVDETRERLLQIARRLIDDDGIEGLILGCTELPLILPDEAFGIPFLNTAKIHAHSVVRFCLTGE